MNTAALLAILKIIGEAVVLTNTLREIARRAAEGEEITEEELDAARAESQALVDEWNNEDKEE